MWLYRVAALAKLGCLGWFCAPLLQTIKISTEFASNSYKFTITGSRFGTIQIKDAKDKLTISAEDCEIHISWPQVEIFWNYQGKKIHYKYHGRHYLTISTNTKQSEYKMTLTQDDTYRKCFVNCKRFAPGISNFKLQLSGGETLVGDFSGNCYSVPFYGKASINKDSGSGILHNKKTGPIKLILKENGQLGVHSEKVNGMIDLPQHRAQLKLYDHSASLEEGVVHVAGPKVCASCKFSPYLQITGPSLIYTGNLLQPIWFDASSEHKYAESRLCCDNFQRPGIKLRFYQKDNKYDIILRTQTSSLCIKKTNNRLSVESPEIGDFNQIIEDFIVTGGQLESTGRKVKHKWYGKIAIHNAKLSPDYQINVPNNWTITGKWQWDGDRLCFKKLMLKNQHAEIMLNGYLKGDYIECNGSLLRINMITRITRFLTRRHFFATPFSIHGKIGETKCATNRFSLIYTWVSYLPI